MEANYYSATSSIATLAFDLAKYLVDDFDFLPWSIFMSRVKFYTDLFESESSSSLLQTFLRNLVKKYYSRLTWIEDEQNDEWSDRLVT